MNAAGLQGWELVAVLYGDNSTSQFNQGSKVILWWKREVDVELGETAAPATPFVGSPDNPFVRDFR